MADRKCIKCLEAKPLETAFSYRKDRGNYHTVCKACRNVRTLAARRANPELARKYFQNFKKNNPEAYRRNYTRWNAKRYANPASKLAVLVSARVTRTLKGERKHAPTFEVFGYTPQELKEHLERQFLKGMSWDNYGEWHVDHITPISSFNYTSMRDPEFKAAWALTNLRPMWGSENCQKGAKIVCLL